MTSEESKKPAPKEYSHVVGAFESGSVFSATKAELQEYLLALGRAQILSPVNQAKAAEMGATIRHLLTSLLKEEPASASQPNTGDSSASKMTVFVGSSTEAKSQAKALMRDLSSPRINFLPWWDCFTPGHLLLADLEEVKKKKATAALLLFTPDIPAKLRGKKVTLPNQNVLFELGYFFSAFAPSRIALIRYGATYIPKDLDGYTHIPGSSFFKPGGSMVAAKKTKDAFTKWAVSL